MGAILDYCGDYPPDLIVLATHQRDGLACWTHKSVAEPLVRRSGVMTLFVPRNGKGFVSLLTGEICFQKVLIPVDHDPNGQVALGEAYFLTSGLGVEEARFDLLHVGGHGKISDASFAAALRLDLGKGDFRRGSADVDSGARS